MDPTKRWQLELRREAAFWTRHVHSGGGEFPNAFALQCDPDALVRDGLILDRLDLVDADPVRIIDVGAGPLSMVGTRHPDRAIDLTAVDPLAHDYDLILAEAGIDPPVRTIQCRGEDVLERFGPARFDFAYSRNAVDHSVDPLAILRNMIGVVKPGGFVLLRHYRNEGVAENYEGLHQWNFDVRDGRLFLWSRRATHDLHEVLGDQVEIEAEIQPWSVKTPWIACALRRR